MAGWSGVTAIALGVLWSGVVLLAWLGTGVLLRRLLARSIGVHAGLLMAWGVAAHLAIGGALLATGDACRPVLIVLTATAALPGAFWLWRARPWRTLFGVAVSKAEKLAWSALVASLALVAIANVSTPLSVFKPGDDWTAYLPFIERILELGHHDEPYSLRRLAAYGGQSYLGAQAQAATDVRAAGALERGLTPVALAMLVAAAWQPRTTSPRWRVLGIALCAMIAFAPTQRVNIASIKTGALLFLAIGLTLQATSNRVTARGAIVGLLVAGLVSLRANYVVAAASLPGLWLLASLVLRRGKPHDTPRPIGSEPGVAATAACVAVIALLPWAYALHRSSESWFYPAQPGTHRLNPEYLTRAAGPAERLAHAVPVATQSKLLIYLLPILPLLLSSGARRDPLAWALCASAAVTLLATSYALPDSDPGSIRRYVFQMILAALAYAVAAHVRDADATPRSRFGAAVAAVTIVGLLVVAVVREAYTVYRERRLAFVVPWPGPFVPAETRSSYEQLQASTAAGSRVFAAVDLPFLLDLRRNDVVNLDMPGYCGPPPDGMPVYKGDAALEQFLRAQRADYLVYTEFAFDRPGLWDARMWQETQGIEPMFAEAFRMLQDFEHNARAIAARNDVVWRGAGMVVVRLSR
jgi:hypothetical protein